MSSEIQGDGMRAAALRLAKRYAVVPIKPRGKSPLLGSWLKYQKVKPSEADIKAWFTKWPNAKVGIVCGHDGLAVLDIDDTALAVKLTAQLKNHVPLVRTPSGGLHAYFRESEPSSGGPLAGVGDIKSAGGLVVVPPSSGYIKLNTLSEPFSVENLRDYASVLLAGHGIEPPERTAMPLIGDTINEGSRDETLTSLAGSLRSRGLSEGVIKAALTSVNESVCKPPLAATDIAKIARSVSKYDPAVGAAVEQLLKEFGNAKPSAKVSIELQSAQDVLAEFNNHPTPEYIPVMGQMGYIVKGWSHLFAGLSKSGKSEFVCEVVKDYCNKGGRCLWITEENRYVWGWRWSLRGGAPNNLTLAFALNTDPAAVEALMREHKAEFVVLDTARTLLAIHDENDNALVARRLAPIVRAQGDTKKTLLMIHHSRKSGGEYGTAAAGAGAWTSSVDISLDLVRYDPDADSRVREIRGRGRVMPIEPMLYEMDDDYQFSVIGNPKNVKAQTVAENVLNIINHSGTWISRDDILARLASPTPSREQVRRALNQLYEDGKIMRDPEEPTAGKEYTFRSLNEVPSSVQPTTGPTTPLPATEPTTDKGTLQVGGKVGVNSGKTDVSDLQQTYTDIHQNQPTTDNLLGGASLQVGVRISNDPNATPYEHDTWDDGPGGKFTCTTCGAVWDYSANNQSNDDTLTSFTSPASLQQTEEINPQLLEDVKAVFGDSVVIGD